MCAYRMPVGGGSFERREKKLIDREKKESLGAKQENNLAPQFHGKHAMAPNRSDKAPRWPG